MKKPDRSSRTYKSIKNSLVALIIFLINLLIQFFSRKIFIDKLGTEVVGLNTTATSLLQFLNLAELGVGGAVISTLYKPLSNKNYEEINEIISLQGWLYRKIASVVVGGSLILMLFFPFIFDKMELPLWYAYATYSVLLFSSLLSYFFNYKQIVLSADQQEYKIQYSYRIVLLLKLIVQIFAVSSLEKGYIWWLALEVVFAVMASVVLNITIQRTYPKLKTTISKGKTLSKKHPTVTTRIKQFFFHKIAGFALTQTSPIIIYAYTTLTMVAVYGNYMIIINGALSLLNAIFNGMASSVGNLVAEGDRKRILKVFNELIVSRFFLVGTCTFLIYELADELITYWLGADMLLEHTTVFLIVTLFFLNTIRSVVDSFINAFGIFRDIWAPLVEALLNISLSILLGYHFGINGILTGVIISLLLIVYIWKPYFLFHYALQIPLIEYVKIFVRVMLIMIAVMFVVHNIINHIPINPMSGIFSFLIYATIVSVSFVSTFYISLYLMEGNMRTFINRFKQ